MSNQPPQPDKAHRFWTPIVIQSVIGAVTIYLSMWTVQKQLEQNAATSKSQLAQSAELLDKQLKSSAELAQLQIKASSETTQMQIQANADASRKQVDASFAALDRQFRLQREQNEYQDKVAAARAHSEQKARYIKDVVEALAEFEEIADQHADDQSAAAYHSAASVALLAHSKPGLKDFSDAALHESTSKLTYARSKLRSSLAMFARAVEITNLPPLKASMDSATARLMEGKGYTPLVNKATVDRLWDAEEKLFATKDVGPFIGVMLDIRMSITQQVLQEDKTAAEQVRAMLAQLPDAP